MGVESQETRSLPRNRKCGNCRFYEPAPLWRKGWCRNPKLYPPHANHLVDSTSIDCEGGFRSRIYWEPLPLVEEGMEAQQTQPMPRPLHPHPQSTQPIYNVQPRPVDQPFGGSYQQQVAPPIPPVQPRPQASFQQPSQQTRPTTPPPITPAYEPEPIPVVDAVVIEHPADPSVLQNGAGANGPDWRNKVRQNLPFTRNWPLEKVTFTRQNAPFWGVGAFVVLVILFLLLSNIGKKPSPDPAQLAATQATATAQVEATVAATQATAQAQITTAPVATPTPTKPPVKTAIVKGNGATPLNIREDATTKAKPIATVKEGEKVTILEGPKDADGHGWYKVDYNGKVGWAAKDYLEIQP